MATRNLYDRVLDLTLTQKATLALEHWEAFQTVIEAFRDSIVEDDYSIAPKHDAVSALLAYIDEETQHVTRRVEALAHEAKQVK